MSDVNSNNTENLKLNEMQEKYLENIESIEEGQLLEGVVIEVTPDVVFVDVGYKSEGRVSTDEFEEKPEIGDKVEVVLVRKETTEGQIVVSKRKADMKTFWQELKNADTAGAAIKGTIKQTIKGGYQVDLGFGVTAFLPISKAEIGKTEDPETLIGTKSDFSIEKLNIGKRTNIVVNRKNVLIQQLEEKREGFFENTSIGDDVEGVVKSFTSFGAFIDLGGFDGLLHMNDMSWGHVARPRDYVKKGEKIKVKVIRLDSENNKINLSLKHFKNDPWENIEDKYETEQVVNGKVTKLTDFGAFVELEEGIEGLAHISELSWLKHIDHPREVLSIGDEVETKILSIDTEQQRISLGIKQVEPNPWDAMEEKFPVGTRLSSKISSIVNNGAVFDLEEGIEGFLHKDDVSWTKKVKSVSSIAEEGDEIDVMVIKVDKRNRTIKLGIKQLSEDPWESFGKGHRKGSLIEGEITNITDFGIFVKVQGDIEGLVNKNQLTMSREEDPDEKLKEYSVGDTIKVAITEINPKRKKLALSVREYRQKVEQKEIEKYIHDDDDDDDISTFTLGDFLNKK